MNKKLKQEASEDEYENDGADGFEKEDADDESRLRRIRDAMAKENKKAAEVAVRAPEQRKQSAVVK